MFICDECGKNIIMVYVHLLPTGNIDCCQECYIDAMKDEHGKSK